MISVARWHHQCAAEAVALLAVTALAACSSSEPTPTGRVPLADAVTTMAPQPVWQHFYELTQVPRRSKHEQKATTFVADFGRGLGLETIVDGVGNVLIRRPAAPSMAASPGLVLQAHLDMVALAASGYAIDFDTDPINAYVENGLVRAEGSTLGADDGMGVALIMALLNADIPHGPLEALFTVDEEGDFTGIDNLSPEVLQGRLYINVDNEQEGTFTISSAGGVYVDVVASYQELATPAGMAGYQLAVGGLIGGHSGIDIDKGRGSAHQIISRLLVEAPPAFDVRVGNLLGGDQRNAIPRNATAAVALPPDQAAAFGQYVSDFAATVARELAASDPEVTVTMTPASVPALVMEPASQQALIHAVYTCPQGVYKMSDDVPGLVETSGNLGVLTIAGGRLDAVAYVRSAIDSERDAEAERFSVVFEDAGATVTLEGAYSSWPPNPDSPLLALMTRAYTGLFGTAPTVSAVHAGLETSVAGVKYPGMDMISIGPTTTDVHTADERLEVASVQKVYDLLVATLGQIDSVAAGRTGPGALTGDVSCGAAAGRATCASKRP
jgi:dipeptidase D